MVAECIQSGSLWHPEALGQHCKIIKRPGDRGSPGRGSPVGLATGSSTGTDSGRHAIVVDSVRARSRLGRRWRTAIGTGTEILARIADLVAADRRRAAVEQAIEAVLWTFADQIAAAGRAAFAQLTDASPQGGAAQRGARGARQRRRRDGFRPSREQQGILSSSPNQPPSDSLQRLDHMAPIATAAITDPGDLPCPTQDLFSASLTI